MLFRKLKSIIVVLLCIVLVGCGSETESDKLKIISTSFPGYDFARAIGSENIDVEMLLNPGEDSHSFDPTPKDIINIEESDIFIYVGKEAWAQDILAGIDTSKVKVIRLMDYVELKEEEIVEGMEHNHDEHNHEETHADHDHDETHDEHDHEESHDDHTNEKPHDNSDLSYNELSVYDEHIWTSLHNSIHLINILKEDIIKLDEGNKTLYETNATNYINEMEKLNNEINSMISTATKNEIIVGDRFPFRYFVDDYDLEYSAAFSGCSTATEASAKTIAFLVDKMNNENISHILKIELSNGNIAETIAAETNSQVLELHSAHNLTLDDFDSGKTYLDFMRQNYETLKVALN